MKSKWLLITLLPVTIAMQCPSSASNPMMGTQNDNTSSGNQATLTLRITGPVDGEFARVYGIVNDGPQTHADLENRSPQSDFKLTLGQSVGTGMIEQSFQFDKGTKIALVAVEGDGFLTPTAPPDPIVSHPMQFTSWGGDYTNADIGPNPATLYFTLDGDRTIEAQFSAMNPIFITAQGGNAHSNMLVSVNVDRYIIPPRPVEDSGVGVDDIGDDNILWGFMRDGAVLTLTIKDYTDNAPNVCGDPSMGPCWVFVAWYGDCLGQGKTCTLTFGQASDAMVLLRDQNAP